MLGPKLLWYLYSTQRCLDDIFRRAYSVTSPRLLEEEVEVGVEVMDFH